MDKNFSSLRLLDLVLSLQSGTPTMPLVVMIKHGRVRYSYIVFVNEQEAARLVGWRRRDDPPSMNAYVVDDVMSCVAAHRALSAATTSCACASFLCLFIAVTTDYWLYTVERVSDANTTSPSVYLATSSGLWRKCAHKRMCSHARQTTWTSSETIP